MTPNYTGVTLLLLHILFSSRMEFRGIPSRGGVATERAERMSWLRMPIGIFVGVDTKLVHLSQVGHVEFIGVFWKTLLGVRFFFRALHSHKRFGFGGVPEQS